MRSIPVLSLAALLFTPSLAFAQGAPAGGAPATPPPPPFTLSSASFQDGGVIPDKYTQANPSCCVSPALSWVNAPGGTVTYTLLMHDPDNAPQKKVQDTLHWMAFNIPGSTTSLPEGVPAQATLPDGTVQLTGGGNTVGYRGPGARGIYHHYTIELFALDTKLDLPPSATREQVTAAIDGHIVGKAVVEGRFHR